MRARARLGLLIAGLTMAAVAGIGAPAAAYCEDGTTSRCSNSCTRTAEAWEKATGIEAPWACPM